MIAPALATVTAQYGAGWSAGLLRGRFLWQTLAHVRWQQDTNMLPRESERLLENGERAHGLSGILASAREAFDQG